MNIKELIETLQREVDRAGDSKICIWNHSRGEILAISSIHRLSDKCLVICEIPSIKGKSIKLDELENA